MKTRNSINSESYFSKNDIVKVPRSTFYRNQDKKMTFNAGDLNIFFIDEVLPGDTFDMSINSVIRFASPMIRPVMDSVNCDLYAFFVPSRLLDDNFESVIANYQKNPNWSGDVTTTLSTLTIPGLNKDTNKAGFEVGSVADQMGLPVEVGGDGNEEISLLPFRAYTLIWDYFFRDEALQDEISIENAGEQHLIGINKDDKDYEDYRISALRGGKLCPLNKYHDYFTSALPQAQKGAPVTIASLGGIVPVSTTDTENGFIPLQVTNNNDVRYDVGFSGRQQVGGVNISRFGAGYDLNGADHDITHGVSYGNNDVIFVRDKTFTSDDLTTYRFGTYLDNTFVDLGNARSINVNDLRLAFQFQKMKELDARYGTRYSENLLGHWGVIAADSRLQKPEFLGKQSITLNVNQSIQSNGTTEDSPQGNPAAYSLTGNNGSIFNKSFVEHGYILIVGGVRIPHRTYSQGIDPMWGRKTRLDFYDPLFGNLGEQPIKNKEIYFTGAANGMDNEAFGYQEYGAPYRYLPNKAVGYMRPEIEESLSVWSYAEAYDQLPTLSPDWIKEDSTPIDRTLAIPAATAANFIADFYFKNKATRPMELHSVPGLIDHSGKIIY